jgi:hypothetical protein
MQKMEAPSLADLVRMAEKLPAAGQPVRRASGKNPLEKFLENFPASELTRSGGKTD